MGKGIAKPIQLSQEELLKLCEQAADRGVKKYLKAQAEKKENEKNAMRYNVKVLLENYIRFKYYIENAVKSIEDMEGKELGEDGENVMRIFGLRSEDKKIMSVQRSVLTMSMLMAHVDRMLDAYKIACTGSTSVVIQRRWEVIERMYLRENRMTTNQIAEEFNLEPRNIREDAKMAREDLKAQIFGIEAIIMDLV